MSSRKIWCVCSLLLACDSFLLLFCGKADADGSGGAKWREAFTSVFCAGSFVAAKKVMVSKKYQWSHDRGVVSSTLHFFVPMHRHFSPS